MVLTMNSKEILWPDKQLTDQIQKAKKIQRRTLSRRPLWELYVKWTYFARSPIKLNSQLKWFGHRILSKVLLLDSDCSFYSISQSLTQTH